MAATTDPYDRRYFDEPDLRRELALAFAQVGSDPTVESGEPWARAVEVAIDGDAGGKVASLSPAAQDAVVDAWAAIIEADHLSLAEEADTAKVVALVRRALQVRVRNDGLTRAQWVDRTFAGLRAPWARALVRSFGTAAGRGSCRCLDAAPIVDGWQCCGSPWLDNGDVERFIRRARRNVAVLDGYASAGRAVSIADPVCRAVVTEAYLTYVGGPATQRVADAFRR